MWINLVNDFIEETIRQRVRKVNRRNKRHFQDQKRIDEGDAH